MRLFHGRLMAIYGALIISSALFSTRGAVLAGAFQSPGIPSTNNSSEQRRDWPAYGGASENTHYSSLAQIDRTNVKELTVAWSFDTGEEGGLETSPIIVGGILYGITPTQKVFALDAASGKLLWKFDSGVKGTQLDRGLAYWSSE